MAREVRHGERQRAPGSCPVPKADRSARRMVGMTVPRPRPIGYFVLRPLRRVCAASRSRVSRVRGFCRSLPALLSCSFVGFFGAIRAPLSVFGWIISCPGARRLVAPFSRPAAVQLPQPARDSLTSVERLPSACQGLRGSPNRVVWRNPNGPHPCVTSSARFSTGPGEGPLSVGLDLHHIGSVRKLYLAFVVPDLIHEQVCT